jgi:hypothetical protein
LDYHFTIKLLKTYFNCLLAYEDADGLFTGVDIGDFRKNSHGAVCEGFSLEKKTLELNAFHLPLPKFA